MVFGLIRKIQCGLTVSRKGLLCGVWTYLGKVLSTVCGLTQEGYFVQCVDYGYFRRAFWRDWAYPAVYGIYTVYGPT